MSISDSSGFDRDTPGGKHQIYIVAGSIGWCRRAQFIPEGFMYVPRRLPVQKVNVAVSMEGKYRHRWRLVREDYYIVQVSPDALVTAAIFGEEQTIYFSRWNNKHILRRHLMAYSWTENPEGGWPEQSGLQRRAERLAEWTSRCAFWPFE